MAEPRGPGVGLFVVRIASWLVPRADRRAWRGEWEAELTSRWHQLVESGALSVGARADLAWRALGSVVDAVTYGEGRWSMAATMEDLAYALRGVRRRPGFAAVVILTLAVGIGANTAIFGVARDVLLRPYPYPDADRLVAMETHTTSGRIAGNVSYPNMSDLAAGSGSMEGIAVMRVWVPALEDDRGSVVLRGATVTADYFSLLGVSAGVGRFFRPEEQGEGRPAQVVLSHPFWVDHFGADPSVVGSDVRLSGTPFTVIGVTAADFEDPGLQGGPGSEPQIWRTVASPVSEWPRSGRSWRAIGRVRSDATLASAQAELDGLYATLVAEYPEHNAERFVVITPLRERVAGPARPALLTLVGSVALLLLVACANLANLLLGRALDRRGEMALHRALGAPGWRLVHRTLAEAGILAVAGGGLGLAVAAALGGLATRLGPMLPRSVTGELDGGLLLFAAGVTVGTALLFGTVPAVRAARGDGAVGPGGSMRRSTLDRSGQRLRRYLVVGELALTTTLLVGAGLLVRSLNELGAVELGFRTEGVVAMTLHGAAWWELEAPAAQAQWNAVLEAVRAVPTVDEAGALDYLPLSGDYSCDGVYRADRPQPEPGEGSCAEVRVVLPGALEALGIPLSSGRLLDGRDGADQPPVAVIDESMAEAHWPGENPIGKRFHVHTKVHEVVGVVADMLHFGPGDPHRPMVYLHAPQEGWNGIARGLSLVASGADPGTMVDPIRRAVASVNPSIAIGSVETLDGMLGSTLAGPRFRTLLMVAFGVTALLLAALGVAGVMTYSVSRRTRELGVRLALGAKPAEVRSMVFKEGVGLAAAGLTLGLVGALLLTGFLEALLFQVAARDPLVYAAVAGLLGAVATVACFVPARRASRVDPISALGSE